jgi:hypothetical protein
MPRTFYLRTLSIVMLLCVQLMGYEVKMRVVDETGAPVAGAMTKIIFIDHGPETVHVGVSSRDGSFSARGRGTNSVMLKASKDGYYPVRVENLSKDKDHDMEVVLSRVLNPIPLYALRIDDDQKILFPVRNQWVGFDLELADWVAPHGIGKTADFLLRFRNEFKGFNESWKTMDERIETHKRLLGYSKEEWTMDKFKIHAGRWDAVVEMSFPDEGEGIFEEKRLLAYSPMKLPHLAPEGGYVTAWSCKMNNYDDIFMGGVDTGFFLRTRVRRDVQGKIVSANYTKIIGRLRVASNTGRIDFLYYFNPAPNDRNLEFDPKKNLFPKDKPGANVYDP